MSNGGVVDLRSDTFTVPDAPMRAAIAAAEVGDDVWGEDPTVRRLEERVAGLLGKEAAMYTPSGTMANLCAVLSQTRPGDEVITDAQAHVVVYEAAGAAALGGVQLRLLDYVDGAPTPEEVGGAVRPSNIHSPTSRLLTLENTHNRRGGMAVPRVRIERAATAARERGLRVHCDGARLFNAAIALDEEPDALAAPCDTVSVCFSKGLGAPVGSALTGSAEMIDAARRWRKRLGGGMRQAGVIAAAALYALEHNRARLADDHANAALIAETLDGVDGAELLRVEVPTNIVILRTSAPAAEVIATARERGVLVSMMDTHLVRCMTYLGVSEADCRRAAAALRDVLSHTAVAAAAS